MDITFEELTSRHIMKCFYDDMVLHTATIEEHYDGLCKMIEIMKVVTLKVSIVKCDLFVNEVKFLGKLVSLNQIRNCPSKARCILEMPLPLTLGRLQGALGVFNYHRDFVPMFADISEPCYRMLEIQDLPKHFITKKNTIHPKYPLPWTEEGKASFERLKQETGKALELAQPDFNLLFHLETDASEKAYGGKLFQLPEPRSIGYHSHTYTSAQKKYSAGEKELLAIVMCIEHFHYFLCGRYFIVYSDHMPLSYLLKKSSPSKRLERWMERLASYSFTIYFKPGKENTVADTLSRMYDDEEEVPIADSDLDYHDIMIAAIVTPTEDKDNTTITAIELASPKQYATFRGKQETDPDIA